MRSITPDSESQLALVLAEVSSPPPKKPPPPLCVREMSMNVSVGLNHSSALVRFALCDHRSGTPP